MSERPKKGAPEGQPDNGSAMGELREGFDEIYGNLEGFSKRAVGSLFDDDKGKKPVEKYERAADRGSSRPKRPSRAQSAERLSRAGESEDILDLSEKPTKIEKPARTERPGFAHEPDPDEEYARYIRTAEQANRTEQEKQRADKQQALIERDEKLSEVSYISRRREETAMRNRDMEKTDLYAHKSRGGNMEANFGGRRLNVRNVAAVGAFLALVVCAVLTWQMLAARSDLAAANERLEDLSAIEQELGSLRIAYNGQTGIISQLNAQLADYQERLQTWENVLGPITGTPGAENGENGDPAEGHGDDPVTPPPPAAGDLPYTTINPQGQRVYTVQPNDTVWSIAFRIYGDGTRYAEILAANNMTSAQAAGMTVGTILVIPD
ncbi:MAG: LysM peptidoglycan-binding domain-containing protein [Clostridiales bacterium]|nr:LysM peptidoglycan-binding domain-containing protein [Clostridiales bacterium]